MHIFLLTIFTLSFFTFTGLLIYILVCKLKHKQIKKMMIPTIAVSFLLFIISGSIPVSTKSSTTRLQSKIESVDKSSTEKNSIPDSSYEESSKSSVFVPNPEPSVSREFSNALKAAESYLSYSAFSQSGLKAQLIYEKYPDDAAQYAVDNVKTDWNENALKAAKSYLDYSAFSDDGLREQLAYENYTPEQIEYAMGHLPH